MFNTETVKRVRGAQNQPVDYFSVLGVFWGGGVGQITDRSLMFARRCCCSREVQRTGERACFRQALSGSFADCYVFVKNI